MEILLAATLPLIILACVAYYFFAPGPESEFYKKFSLDNVLRKTMPLEIDFPANGISPVGVCLYIDGTNANHKEQIWQKEFASIVKPNSMSLIRLLNAQFAER